MFLSIKFFPLQLQISLPQTRKISPQLLLILPLSTSSTEISAGFWDAESDGMNDQDSSWILHLEAEEAIIQTLHLEDQPSSKEVIGALLSMTGRQTQFTLVSLESSAAIMKTHVHRR